VTRTFEVTAVAFGILAVFWNARQNPWGWGAGLVNNALYTLLFFQGRLYALMGLQVCFASVAVYGWYQWLRGGTERRGVRVAAVPRPLAARLAVQAVVGAALLAWALDRFTDGQQPVIDAGLAVVSLTAQWMMARKYWETWWIWVGVNVVSVPFFLFRGDWPTALQYSVFLGLAINGLRQWRRALRAGALTTPAPASPGP
jgi:nicotinamide mononucleotide transporter